MNDSRKSTPSVGEEDLFEMDLCQICALVPKDFYLCSWYFFFHHIVWACETPVNPASWLLGPSWKNFYGAYWRKHCLSLLYLPIVWALDYSYVNSFQFYRDPVVAENAEWPHAAPPLFWSSRRLNDHVSKRYQEHYTVSTSAGEYAFTSSRAIKSWEHHWFQGAPVYGSPFLSPERGIRTKFEW